MDDVVFTMHISVLFSPDVLQRLIEGSQTVPDDGAWTAVDAVAKLIEDHLMFLGASAVYQEEGE